MSSILQSRIREAAVNQGIKAQVENRATKAKQISIDMLRSWGAASADSDDGQFGLESLGNTTYTRNRALDVDHIDPTQFVGKLKELGMADRHIVPTAEACLSLFDKSYDPRALVQSNGLDAMSSKYLPLHRVIGSADLLNQYVHEDEAMALEAFGDEINRLNTDDRLSMSLTIMRPYENIMDKNLARVNETSPVVTLRIPNPEVWDWAKTQDANATAAQRNGGNIPLRDLYRNPTPVNTKAKPIVPIAANDPGGLLWAVSNGFYATGKTINTIDLAKDASRYSYAHADRSDIVAEGGKLSSIVISLKSGSTTEYFLLDTTAFELARFVLPTSSRVGSQRQIVLPAILPVTAGVKQYDGTTASTIAAQLTDAVVALNVTVTVTLNLQTGDLLASGTVDITSVVASGSSAISSNTQTLIAGLTAAVVAYKTDIYYDEENQRKANLSVWMQYYEQQFIVPRSRIFFTEYSLTQDVDENAVAATSAVVALGNGRRGLDIVVNSLNTISTALQYKSAHPEIVSYNTIEEQSFASSLVKPTVITSTLDYSNENINVMNESTRLTELHGRFRARLLQMLAVMFAKSLMLNQYKGGERPVIKAWVHSTLADLVIGIVDYHPELKDEAATASGADYSMTLPNGYRLDIVKTNWDCMEGKFFAVPVIESDMASVLSAAHIRDCGSVTTNYTPTNQGAIVKRIATTTREIVMMTNKCGVCINITGLQYQLGNMGYTPVTLNADSSTAFNI